MAHLSGKLLFEEPLAGHTTWRVGGPARQFFKPQHLEDLKTFLSQLSKKEPLFWLGLGSNLLIRDKGFAGTVILMQGGLKSIEYLNEPPLVRVEAGVSCATMARFCARAGLKGGEFWAGIPGTMGGALRMNAGCAGSETWRYVQSVETITREGILKTRTPDTFDIHYRHVEGLEKDEAFVAAICRLEPGTKEQSLERIKTLLDYRKSTQPINEANCGSVFRNPPNDFAARLIESSGLKGVSCGGATVSLKHANFIINEGHAIAKDIENLMELIQTTVYEKHQITLMPEVHLVGEQ